MCSCSLECLDDRYNEYLDTFDVGTEFQTAGINSSEYIAGFQTIDLLITIVVFRDKTCLTMYRA